MLISAAVIFVQYVTGFNFKCDLVVQLIFLLVVAGLASININP